MDVNFPYQFDGRGRTLDPGADLLRQMVEQVLFTSPGERVMRPDFGAGLLALVFEPNSTTLAATTQFLVQSGLQSADDTRAEFKQNIVPHLGAAYNLARLGKLWWRHCSEGLRRKERPR